MRMSTKGVAMLIASEGIVPAPYKDSKGVWTYGIGHTAAAGAPNPNEIPRGMPDDLDAELRNVFTLFRNDLARYEHDVSSAIDVPLKQHQFDALVHFHYNTGGIDAARLTQQINAGDMAGAGESFMRWTKPAEIIPRRKAEQALFVHGTYSNAAATVWNADNRGKVIWKPVRTLSPAEVQGLMRGSINPTTIATATTGAILGGISDYSGLPPAATVAIAVAGAVALFLILRKVKR